MTVHTRKAAIVAARGLALDDVEARPNGSVLVHGRLTETTWAEDILSAAAAQELEPSQSDFWAITMRCHPGATRHLTLKPNMLLATCAVAVHLMREDGLLGA